MWYFLKSSLYGLLLCALCFYAQQAIRFYDFFKVVHNHSPGPCKLLPGLENGSEDIAVLPNGLAIISAECFHRKEGAKMQGRLMSFDFRKPDEPATELKVSGFSGQLNPHGISLFRVNEETTLVYVVNHPWEESQPEDTVEKFSWDTKSKMLTHQKTIRDPLFLCINDLVVVGIDQFYVTNYQTLPNGWMRYLEGFFFLPLQNVVYYNGKQGKNILNYLRGPNGINVSPDKKYLYLAESFGKRLSSFLINSPENLTLHDSKYLGSVPDNLDIDPKSGDIWIGSHQILARMLHPLGPLPSQVLRVRVTDGKFLSSTEVYADDGSNLSWSSVAVNFNNSLLIGTVDHKLMFCRCDVCDYN